ncbi:MAG: hypothetical protein GY906_16285, partial [bacterium]|nr:hypothetical protein [bacterium]
MCQCTRLVFGFLTVSFCVAGSEVSAITWSNHIQVAGVGSEGQGAGVAFVNLDGNSRPEMILMAYDNPQAANNFRYKIGWNVSTNGQATSWSNHIQVAGVGSEGQG